MKTPVEKRKPSGTVDYIALALTTFGVGYGPIAPGTWGSAVGVGIYVFITWVEVILATSYLSKIPISENHVNMVLSSDYSLKTLGP